MNVRTFFELILACGVFYAGALLLLVKLQRKLVFQTYPVLCPPPPPGTGESAHFLLTTADGEKLDAMWLPAKAAQRPAILYFHGNATNLRCRASRIEALAKLGFSILAFDWRGYGKSTGAPSQAGLQLDAEAALD